MNLIIDHNSQKTKIVKVRISDDEDNLLSLISRTSKRTKSDIIRSLFVKLKPVQSSDLIQEFIRLRRDLNSGVGNNLNQLARQANRTGYVSPDLSSALADWKKVKKDLTSLINEVK